MANPNPQLSTLLKWGIENSTSSTEDNPPSSETSASRSLNPEALAALFGGPSDADLMKSSMSAILSPSVALPDKLTAFDNFEQLIESIDNANNLGALELWTPLIGLLESEEPELARMAAWCVGTAVQNNPAAQERALVGGAVKRLVGLVKKSKNNNTGEDEDKTAEGTTTTTRTTTKMTAEEAKLLRRKACYALSSEVRNFQPGLDAVLRALGGEDAARPIDAADMDAVDELMARLRG